MPVRVARPRLRLGERDELVAELDERHLAGPAAEPDVVEDAPEPVERLVDVADLDRNVVDPTSRGNATSVASGALERAQALEARPTGPFPEAALRHEAVVHRSSASCPGGAVALLGVRRVVARRRRRPRRSASPSADAPRPARAAGRSRGRARPRAGRRAEAGRLAARISKPSGRASPARSALMTG